MYIFVLYSSTICRTSALFLPVFADAVIQIILLQQIYRVGIKYLMLIGVGKGGLYQSCL